MSAPSGSDAGARGRAGASALLELSGVTRYFGGLRAVYDVSLDVRAGEVVGLIGPNGAGKTTLVNVITGVHRRHRGEIVFAGRRIDAMRPHRIARLGIARTFQIVQPFPAMSVLDNVAAGALFAGAAAGVAAARADAREILGAVGLDGVAAAPAATLALADRKRLELAKSLAMKPRLLLLDEVNAGLAAAEMKRALTLIAGLAARGMAILLIEHVMKVITEVCSRVVVLHHGELIAEGRPAEILRSPRVVEAYLGSRFAAPPP